MSETNGKMFPCKACGAQVKPPEVVPPMIPREARGLYKISISYPCPSCGANQQSVFTGEVKVGKEGQK